MDNTENAGRNPSGWQGFRRRNCAQTFPNGYFSSRYVLNLKSKTTSRKTHMPNANLTLKDRLSHLNYTTACRLLGPKGKSLINQGGQFDIDLDLQAHLDAERFILNLPGAMVFVEHNASAYKGMSLSCTKCPRACEHMGAALSLVLEEKIALGLAAPPKERTPVESLSEEELVEQEILMRKEKAESEKMTLKALVKDKLWSDYLVTNRQSGKTYRVALRGWERGESYCSCPDFRKNTLGTCKHLLYALSRVKKKFGAAAGNRPYKPRRISVHVKYGMDRQLRLSLPESLPPRTKKVLNRFTNGKAVDAPGLIASLKKMEAKGREVMITPDALEYIREMQYKNKIKTLVKNIRKKPATHPLRKDLLKCELLPYQLDGIAFAAGAGRAVLADDMGLGKTIQGIGTAELLHREAGITKTLVVCPASVKSQWKNEIEKFSDKEATLVVGGAPERIRIYESSAFFTICNYEQVVKDITNIGKGGWDFIILDEGQRIKNWEAKTSRAIKALKSPFALVLSGTPLENRLEELHSVVEFIDERKLGPQFRFHNTYRVVDEKGKVLGYKNLDDLRKRLKPVLLRRTRESVMQQLPGRSMDIRRVQPTAEQRDLHDSSKKSLAAILAKRYLTEMDLLRIQKLLLLCRMTADSTALVDKQFPGYSSKLEELKALLGELVAEAERKILIFSEWTTMLDLIEPILKNLKADFVRLDGSVPQKKRQQLVHRFQRDEKCRLFLTTNAGSTGLNLQAADTVINVDLPWNPAVLEQRIARAHRMGQKRKVHVILLVTEDTIEENMLATLSAKKKLSLAVLDPDTDVKNIRMQSGIEEMKKRLEVLLGKKPEAEEEEGAAARARLEKAARAGGHLLQNSLIHGNASVPGTRTNGSASSGGNQAKTRQLETMFKKSLQQCAEPDGNGGLRLTLQFDDPKVLNSLAKIFSAAAG